ncbi:sigma-70 family RNA polymerase sigma factor [Chromobacterium alticapitis]|uniref:sigma-70 family RNA polymerase sigma factor n=1 Tax=Chromobacterium alticapitis TaxID=2073169 RepID=UPI001304E1B1|nr:sigma-70 family RNA polymerase sigma factor [Chromobacterium alticapitis]
MEAHQSLVRILAARIYAQRVGNSFEFGDLFHWGMIGLLEAIDRYRPDCGVAFKTYAEHRIRGEILDRLASTSEVANQSSVRNQIMRERAQALEAKAVEPFAMLRELSVEFAIGFMLEDSGMYLADPDAPAPDMPYRALELKQARRALLAGLKRLPEHAQKVLRLHYLNGVPFAEVARIMALSKGRVSQLHKDGLNELRRHLTSEEAGWG